MKNPLLPIALSGMLSVFGSAHAAEQAIDHDKLSYGIGALVAKQLLSDFDQINVDELVRGVRAQLDGAELEVDNDETMQMMRTYQTQRAAALTEAAIAKGEAYLKENAQRSEVTTTDSGLQYEVISAGDGKSPAAEDSVTVHYRGTLLDGTEFDSSYSRNEPASFKLNQVIAGWTEGLQLMSENAKYKFVIPADLAYGERGAGQSIGPNETLIFEVELIKVGE